MTTEDILDRSILQIVKNRFVLRELADKNYLVPLTVIPDNLIVLDKMGVFFWEVLSKAKSLSEAVRRIAQKYQITSERAERDLDKFVKDVDQAKFVNDESQQPKKIISNTPISGSIELTGKCNLCCFHCYAFSERARKGLDYQEWRKIITELKEEGCLYLQITGGECMVHPDFAKIYRDIRKMGIIPTISTNGTMVTEKIVKLLKQLPPILIRVSLYGSQANTHEEVTRVRGSFTKTLTGVKKLKEASLRVMFVSTLFEHNVSEIEGIKQLAKKIGVPVHFYKQLIPTLDRRISHLDKRIDDFPSEGLNEVLDFYPKKQEKRAWLKGMFDCSAGTKSFHIDADGTLFMCKVERGKGFPLVTKRLKTIWPEMNRYAKEVLIGEVSCQKCQIVDKCHICPPKSRLALVSGTPNLYCNFITK